MGVFDAGQTIMYDLQLPENGIYLFLIEGELEVEGETIYERDAYGAVEFESVAIHTKAASKILIIEVPMKFSENYGN